MLRPYWRTRRRFARRPAGCCASDSAWGTFACRDRRPAASASTPITSAPVAAGSGRCSSTNTRPVACSATAAVSVDRSEEHTSELQSRLHLVCRLLLEKKKTKQHEQ